MKKLLLDGSSKIGVWGTGFIGYSTMANFSVSGIRTVGTDVDSKLIDTINRGEIPIDNLEYWLGFDVRSLVDKGLIRATGNWRDLLDEDVAVHMVAIPTERDGAPWDDALIDVIGKITNVKNKPLVIVESTLTPNRTDNVVIPIFEEAGLKVGEDVLLGVAPRRDWFISPEKSLRNLPRVFGGVNRRSTDAMKGVLRVICDHLVEAPDHRHAEMVKSLENAYRHVEITLANQLSLAYPDVDMREVLRLVGTKWNIGTFQPSFGIGGYCIPLSSQYALLGAKHPEHLTLLDATIESDSRQPEKVVESLIKRGVKNVGIMGLAYKGDIKVHILSPTMKIVEGLRTHGIPMKIHDPYYTKDEIDKLLGIETFDFPEGLDEFDTLLVVTDHRLYKFTPHDEIKKYLSNCRTILDNTGIWKEMDFEKSGTNYFIAGGKDWLG